MVRFRIRRAPCQQYRHRFYERSSYEVAQREAFRPSTSRSCGDPKTHPHRYPGREFIEKSGGDIRVGIMAKHAPN